MSAMRILNSLARVAIFAGLVCQLELVVAQPSPNARIANVQERPEPVFLSFAKFKIPFSVHSQAANLTSVQLWVSTDGGTTWQMHGSAPPTDEDFSFKAAAEGRYLFAVQTVDAQGRVFPSPNPPMDVVVDTTKPEVAVQADTNATGQLVVETLLLDDYVDLKSANLRFRTDRDPSWQSIEVSEFERGDDDVYRGEVKIALESCREVALVFSVLDRAGNSNEATFTLDMPRTANSNREMTLASAGNQSAGIARTEAADSSPSSPRLAGSDAWQPARQTPPSGAGASLGVKLQRPGRLVTAGSGLELEPSAGAQGGISKHDFAEELPAPPRAANGNTRRSWADGKSTSSEEGANGIGGAYQCRSRAFALDYAIEALGGGTLADVELWGTEDGGRTWQQWGSDPDRQSPFDVQVGNDGLFGFRMAIVGSNGQVSNRPKDGDKADMWINVDTQPPKAKITRAVYGEGDNDGMLVIDYTCQDSNLVEQPVTLSYSESLDGDWKTIVSGQKNSGLYIWKPSPNLPNQMYLRLEVADQAGNIGTHRLELPIDTKGLGPMGRIQGFRPILNPGK